MHCFQFFFFILVLFWCCLFTFQALEKLTVENTFLKCIYLVEAATVWVSLFGFYIFKTYRENYHSMKDLI